METKIKIKKVTVKKTTDTYTIRQIEAEDGKKYDTFDDVKEGTEVTGTITPNQNEKYNANFKLAKPEGKKGFPIPKDWTFEKKKFAMDKAIELACSDKINLEKITEYANKIFDYVK